MRGVNNSGAVTLQLPVNMFMDTTATKLNLIGFLNDPRGLGQVAQGVRDALDLLRVNYFPMDVSDVSFENSNFVKSADSDASINLSVINPSELFWVSEKFGEQVYEGRFNIGNWSWELGNSVPAIWKQNSYLFDEVWTCSQFAKKTFEQQLELPSHVIYPVVKLRPYKDIGRAEFGITSGDFVFLFICDFKSKPNRKNPLALVRAFKKAFPDGGDVKLIIKISSATTEPVYWQQLQSECADVPTISLINEIFTKEKLDALIGICDVYVSLHRCEGFGITLAEAMLARKPVIATGWSGNIDFMNAENSYLVDYELITLQNDDGPYMAGEVWADPSVDHAAQCMRQAYENRTNGAESKKIDRAEETIKNLCSLESVARAIDDRLRNVTPFARTLQRIRKEKRQRVFAISPLQSDSPNEISTQRHLASSGTSSKPGREDRPQISVCLPVYNGEEFLQHAIESVLRQDLYDFELLIADDQSTDGSLQIIEQYAKKDARIRYWTNDQRLGLFGNYNRCIQESKGEYVKLFAQDDVLEPACLAEQARVLRRHPAVVLVSCDKTFINELGKPVMPHDFEELTRLEQNVSKNVAVPGQDVIIACFFPVVNLIGEPSTVMFRLRDAGAGFDETFRHVGDLAYWCELLSKGDFFRIGKPLCNFRRHALSATPGNVTSLLFATDTLKLGKKFLQVLNKYGKSYTDFLNDAVYCLAAQSLSLTDRDLYSGKVALQNVHPPADVRDFQELAFRALQFGARSHMRSIDVSAVAIEGDTASGSRSTKNVSNAVIVDPVTRLEEEIRQLLDSPYWRCTKPLRDTNRLIVKRKLTANAESSAEVPFSNESKEVEYYVYLQKLKHGILQSRSWKLTRPFRQMAGASNKTDARNSI